MAAGLGFKTFTTGEVLTAADVNGYLMQGVLVFASEAARNSAITSPQEGQFAYTKDNNSLWYYSGSAWVASGATGDIEGVTAGVGISGGGTSGTVTITNDMATTITASGDIVVGTGSGTYDNLPIGTTGQILTADTTVSPYKVKWAAPAGGASFVGASVYKSAQQSVNNATETASNFDTEVFDTDGFHSNVTNNTRMTIPSGKDGKYLLLGRACFVANTTGVRQGRLRKNGNLIAVNTDTTPGSGGGQNIEVSGIYSAVAGDYFEVAYWQNSGGALNSENGGEYYDAFMIQYLGA